MQTPTTIDAYISKYATILGKQVKDIAIPLHDPTTMPPSPVKLKRKPYVPQAHVIASASRQLHRDRAVIVSAECGTGKTIMCMGIAHDHANGKPYRAIVMCPPTLVSKWEREILETIPGATVHCLRSYRQLTSVDRHSKPTGPEWFVVSETSAKLGFDWEPSYIQKRLIFSITNAQDQQETVSAVVPVCPSCGHTPTKNKDKVPMSVDDIKKRKTFCNCEIVSYAKDGSEIKRECKSPLWTATSDDKWPIATYIHKQLKGYFDYSIFDEIHEENSATSARANAMGSIAAATKYRIGATGTLMGGYAWHVFTMLLRICPRSLIEEGHSWSKPDQFNEVYGRISTKVTTESPSPDNKNSKGRRTSNDKLEPGIIPTLFGRHLMRMCVFLSLDQLADNLPPFKEEVFNVKLDRDQSEAYEFCEMTLRSAIEEMLARRDKRMIGAYLSCLLDYPDHPYGWNTIGYWNKPDDGSPSSFVPVLDPPDLDREKLRPKEKKLIEFCKSERDEKRQVWVYINSTGKRDVAARAEAILKKAGLKVLVLRAEAVPTSKREAWIAKHAPGVDVIISHPRLVRTGLDLFDKNGAHNFVSLVFYQTGYDLFTLRQAARRSWRIGQTKVCKVLYFYYAKTMQARAMSLMGSKLSASEAIEGKFSTEGLAALAGDEGNMETALARSLIDQLDDLDPTKSWSKVTQTQHGNPSVVTATTDVATATVEESDLIEVEDIVIRKVPKRPPQAPVAAISPPKRSSHGEFGYTGSLFDIPSVTPATRRARKE